MVHEILTWTKLDYLFFQSSRILQASEKSVRPRTNPSLKILMLSLQSPHLACHMHTGNLSMLLETDGSLAWPYHCPLVHFALHTMNRCYNRSPILYEGPICRSYHASRVVPTEIIIFSNSISTKKTWYPFTPSIVHQDRLAVFGPKKIPTSSCSFLSWIIRCRDVHSK